MTALSFLNINYSAYVQNVKRSAKKLDAIEVSADADKLLAKSSDPKKGPRAEKSSPEADQFEKALLFIYNFLITFVTFS
jgi:hypothetical protein